jgi:hypothetical protein
LLSYFASGGLFIQKPLRAERGRAARRFIPFWQKQPLGRTFPSVSAAWNVSNERFFKDVQFISSLKIRASWGQLGNQEIGIYPYSSLVSTGNFVYVFGDKIATGATILEIGQQQHPLGNQHPDQLWASTSVSGKTAVSLTLDACSQNETDDILVRVPVPQAGGATRPPFVNSASVENKGIELGLIYKNKIRKSGITASARNISAIRNQVTLHCQQRTDPRRLWAFRRSA